MTTAVPTGERAARDGDVLRSGGFDRNSSRLDAEEWCDLVGVIEPLHRPLPIWAAEVAKKLGDGLVALFGYPVAHENDAERAARSTISIQRAHSLDLNRDNEGHREASARGARPPSEPGPVVVVRHRREYRDAPNVAARAQALAELGSGRCDSTKRTTRSPALRRRGSWQPRTQGCAGACDGVPDRSSERRTQSW